MIKFIKKTPETSILYVWSNTCLLPAQTNFNETTHNSRYEIWKDTKVKLILHYVNTNSYTKFDANILKDDREKCVKLNLSKRKYLVYN